MAKARAQRPDVYSQAPRFATLADHPEVSMQTAVDFLGNRPPQPMGKTPISGWTAEWAASERANELRKRGGVKS